MLEFTQLCLLKKCLHFRAKKYAREDFTVKRVTAVEREGAVPTIMSCGVSIGQVNISRSSLLTCL